MVPCKNCGNEIKPGDNFCASCGTKVNAQPPPPSNLRTCPKCGAVMHAGYIVERDSPMSLWTYGQGVYWTPDEGGTMGSRIALKADACANCGYVEHYIRYIEKDRGAVERAPTSFR